VITGFNIKPSEKQAAREIRQRLHDGEFNASEEESDESAGVGPPRATEWLRVIEEQPLKDLGLADLALARRVLELLDGYQDEVAAKRLRLLVDVFTAIRMHQLSRGE